MIKFGFILLGSALILSACATQLTWQHRAGLDHFVGRTQDELVAALGPPDRRWAEDGVDYAAYVSRSDERLPGIQGGHQRGTDAPAASFVAQDACMTTFRIIGQRVDAWSLRGDACFIAEEPHVSQYAANYAGEWAPGHTSGFVTNRRVQEDPTPGRSVVRYGVFYTR